MTVENWQEAGFGVYVHWPFCQAKCPYCDFNSHVAGAVDHARWQAALVAQVRHAVLRLPGRRVGSIFFGGGTPSLMAPATVAAVIDAVHDGWDVANDLEVTLEANPTSVEAERFRQFADAGVNRVSLGVQALDDTDLRRLGRTHDAGEALAALDVARQVFSRVSFDLIYARQDQTASDWERELRQALALGPDHLSLYQLTVEPGTVFAARDARGQLRGLPGEDVGAEMYELTGAVCAEAGLPGYEVSNHARPGEESRHNLAYWRAGDWVGIGPGAYGRFVDGADRIETYAPPMPDDWLAVAESGPAATETAEPQGGHGEELVMMGLRLVEGIDLRRAARLGATLETGRIGDLVEAGLVLHEGDRLRATIRGRMLLNEIVRQLL